MIQFGRPLAEAPLGRSNADRGPSGRGDVDTKGTTFGFRADDQILADDDRAARAYR
jgi:hypothetical protein